MVRTRSPVSAWSPPTRPTDTTGGADQAVVPGQPLCAQISAVADGALVLTADDHLTLSISAASALRVLWAIDSVAFSMLDGASAAQDCPGRDPLPARHLLDPGRAVCARIPERGLNHPGEQELMHESSTGAIQLAGSLAVVGER